MNETTITIFISLIIIIFLFFKKRGANVGTIQSIEDELSEIRTDNKRATDRRQKDRGRRRKRLSEAERIIESNRDIFADIEKANNI